MPAKPLHLEIWTSSENRQERHYFIRDGNMHGYQRGAYLFGFNPELISEETAARILEMVREAMKSTSSACPPLT